MGLGGAVRRSHQDLALLVGTSYSRPRGRLRPCCCCALLVALLFFVVVIPQMGQLTFHASSSSARSIFFIFSMGQWTPRCPAAVSLFAFLGELYVSFLAGPRPPSLRCCVRWRFARVFPFFLFLLPAAIIYSFFVFPPRCGRVWVSPVVLYVVSCFCVFRQLVFLILQSKDNIRSVGCRRSGLCIYCAFRWSGGELRSRQPGLACRAQVEGGQGGNRGASSGPGWYSMPVSAGGQVGALWSGTRSLRDASLNFLRAMFYCGGRFHNVSFARPPFLVQKVRFCFLLLRSLLGRPRGQGLVCFHTPCPGFFKLR